MRECIVKAVNQISNAMLVNELWEDSTRFFPDPILIENKVYPVIDSEGVRRAARFCYGQGEFWWVDLYTDSEVRVVKFCRIY